MKMSLRGSRKNVDPAAEASKKGRIPTLGEVQKSLKVVHGYDHLFKVYAYGFLFQQLIKTLIQATTHMETLPSKPGSRFPALYRFCNFRCNIT